MKWLKEVIIPGAVGALLIIALPGAVSAAAKPPKRPPPRPGLHTQNVLWDGDDGYSRRRIMPSPKAPVIMPSKRASVLPVHPRPPALLRGKPCILAD